MTFNNYSRHPGETCDIKTSAESRDRRRDSAISEARCKSLERAGRQIVFHEEIVALIVRRPVLYSIVILRKKNLLYSAEVRQVCRLLVSELRHRSRLKEEP